MGRNVGRNYGETPRQRLTRRETAKMHARLNFTQIVSFLIDPTDRLTGLLRSPHHSAAFIAGSKRASKSRIDFSTSAAICLSLSAFTTFRPNTSLT